MMSDNESDDDELGVGEQDKVPYMWTLFNFRF